MLKGEKRLAVNSNRGTHAEKQSSEGHPADLGTHRLIQATWWGWSCHSKLETAYRAERRTHPSQQGHPGTGRQVPSMGPESKKHTWKETHSLAALTC